MPYSYKSKDVEDLFDIGKYTGGIKLKLTWGLCVPDSYKSKDVEDLFDIGKYTGGIKFELTWGLCKYTGLIAASLRMSRVCLI